MNITQGGPPSELTVIIMSRGLFDTNLKPLRYVLTCGSELDTSGEMKDAAYAWSVGKLVRAQKSPKPSSERRVACQK